MRQQTEGRCRSEEPWKGDDEGNKRGEPDFATVPPYIMFLPVFRTEQMKTNDINFSLLRHCIIDEKSLTSSVHSVDNVEDLRVVGRERMTSVFSFPDDDDKTLAEQVRRQLMYGRRRQLRHQEKTAAAIE